MTRETLLDKAIGWRCGIGVALGEPRPTTADPPIAQAAAMDRPLSDAAVAGGAGLTAEVARAAALGELLERYAAVHHPIDARPRAHLPSGDEALGFDDFLLHSREQRQQPGFPHTATYASDSMCRVYDLRTNAPVWVPSALVSNDTSYGTIATSSGLAADPSPTRALLRASQELIERDAFTLAWLHGVQPPRLPPTDADPSGWLAELADSVHAEVTVHDLTPQTSSHRVALVLGSAPLPDGRWRRAAGVACRAGWSAAVRKAGLEWAQAVTFAGATTTSDARPEPADVVSFDDHARFYTQRPDLWDVLPVHGGQEHATAREVTPEVASEDDSPAALMRDLVHDLHRHSIRLLYRDLTTLDVAACGVRVVRVLSPDLAPIHGHHRWPHLASERVDITSRFPGVPRAHFPSPFPHPLG